MNEDFEYNDIVQLKSGGPYMRVRCIHHKEDNTFCDVECEWWENQVGKFDNRTLKMISKGDKWSGFYFDRDKFIETAVKDEGMEKEEAEKMCACLLGSQNIPLKMFPTELEVISDGAIKGESIGFLKIKVGTLNGNKNLTLCCEFEAEVGKIPTECVQSITLLTFGHDSLEPLSVDLKLRILTKEQIKGMRDLVKKIPKIFGGGKRLGDCDPKEIEKMKE